MRVDWRGVFPAVTTQFREDQSLELAATMTHLEALLEAGVHGVVMLGTLGEGTSLEAVEKRAILEATVDTCSGRVPVLAGVAEFTTAAACRLAREAAAIGVDGLMVLPALAYRADRRETLAHYRAIVAATDLPVMVYNNPISYGVDITPEMFVELADLESIVAIKESSDDVRRITDLRTRTADRYLLFCGVDDLALESLLMGADGWLAGLVNAFPRETVRIWDLVQAGRIDEARRLYRWFAPLLHLDTDLKLVQYIKLAVAECGLGSEQVRAPRLPLAGEERERVRALIRTGLETRPALT